MLVHIVIRGSKHARGNRKVVFEHAGGTAFYTTPNKADSIKYIDQDLHIRVAFTNTANAGLFINKLGELDPLAGRPIVDVVETCEYPHPLNMHNMIYEMHYGCFETTGSPGGSRDSLASTGGYMMPNEMKRSILAHQRLEPEMLMEAVPFEMAHIKDRCFCTPDEKKDRNNFLALSPTLHKMFDGSQRGIPTLLVSIESVDRLNPREQTGEDGRKEKLYTVQLCVQYHNKRAADASPVRFKDKTLGGQSGMEHLVEVEVTDHKAFEEYITWKMNDTKNKWDPERQVAVLDGDDDNGGEDSSDDEEG